VSPPVRAELEGWVRCGTQEQRLVLRAEIVLRAAAGWWNADIARTLEVCEETVRKWRGRFADDPRAESLLDAERTGRPLVVPVWVRCELIKLACSGRELPTQAVDAKPRGRKDTAIPKKGTKAAPKTAMQKYAPFHDVWTYQKLSEGLLAETGYRLSRSEIGRILRVEDIRPHHMRVWLHSPDPEFRRKVLRVCQLYLNLPAGSHVVCVDEKPGMQATERRFPSRPASAGRSGRKEFEYIRHGVCALLAGFDVGSGEVVGGCYPNRNMVNLTDLMTRIAQRYSRGDVYIVWDCLNTHDEEKWTAFNRRHGNRFHFVYTPKHASWVNQVEIWFSILQRRVMRYGTFRSVAELTAQVEGFISHWNDEEAHPFRWKFRGRFRPRQVPTDIKQAA